MTTGLMLALGLVGASVGIFLLFRGLEARAGQAAVETSEEVGEVMVIAPVRIKVKKNAREIVGSIMQPLGERLYEREKKVKDKSKQKPGLQQRLLRSGLRLRSGEFLAIQMACVAAASLLGLLRFGFGWQCFAMAGAAYFAPNIYVNVKMNKRQGQFSVQLPEVLMQISNSLRAGVSLNSAIGQVAVSDRGVIAEEFAKVSKEMVLGGAQEEVLQKMVRRVGNSDLELAVIAIGVHRRVGGNLAEILESIAETIRERVRIKGEIKTLTTQARTSGTIITALPILLGIGLYFLMPNYFNPMTQSVIGIGALVAGGMLLGIGNAIMRQIVKIEV